MVCTFDAEQDFWREQGLQGCPPPSNSTTPIPLSPPDSTRSPPALDRLPVEILSRIFALTVEYHSETSPGERIFRYVDTKRPTRLAQVSWRWRSVAIGDQSLWSCMMASDCGPNSVLRVRLWLIRTGSTRPLSLGLGPVPGVDASIGERIIELYLKHVHRWQRIHFRLRRNDINNLRHLSQLEPGSAPQLRVVHIQCSDCPTDMLKAAWAAVSSSTSLQAVNLGNWVPGFVPLEVVPWPQLTHLSLRAIQTQSILDVLKQCKSLEYLTILHQDPTNLQGGPSSRFVLPSLHMLNLHFSVNPAPLLSCFAAPALKDLTVIQGGGDQSARNPAPLHDFLTRSRCSLRYFELSDYDLDERQFIDWITSSMFSSVEFAVLEGNLSDMVFELLNLKERVEGTPGSPILLSSLQKLVVKVRGTSRTSLKGRGSEWLNG